MMMTHAFLVAILAFAPQQDPKKTRVFKQAAEMDYGSWIAATVGVAKDNITPKGIVISLTKDRSANILFDTELLRVSAAWTEGWLHLASRAYADDSNDFTWINGTTAYTTPCAPGWAKGGSLVDPRPEPRDGPLPRDWAKFRGLYVHGDKVILSYTVGTCPVLEMHAWDIDGFTRTLNVGPSEEKLTFVIAGGTNTARVTGEPFGSVMKTEKGKVLLELPRLAARTAIKVAIGTASLSTPEDLSALTRGGPARWKETVATVGSVGKDEGPYAVDTLVAPEQNPYKSWLRFTGVDFLPDGRAALSTWSGDVWLVSGIDAKLEKLTWKRFAAGIGQPMGLKVVGGSIMTAARDQITRLHDLNGDDEADYYECFNNDLKLTTNFHEFTFDLQMDKDGNFWCTKGSAIWAGSQRMTDHSGTVCKISPNGAKLEIVATGLRAPNGIAIGPDGLITCTDNQGNWVPECPINRIKPGGYYGFVGQGQPPREREKPICWIPMSVDKSPGGQVYVPDDRWGPMKGRMIVTSYDCSMSLAMFEKVGEELQGGVVKFPFNFPSGVMRGRFNPAAGQLYLAGMRGWSSRAARDGCFQRVRYTGKPVTMPCEVKTSKGRLDVVFTGALDPASAASVENVGAVQFNVVRTSAYGSPEFSVKDPKKQGRDSVEIKSSKLLPDGRTVSLEIPDLKPVNNLVLKFRLKAADGSPVIWELDYTIHQVP